MLFTNDDYLKETIFDKKYFEKLRKPHYPLSIVGVKNLKIEILIIDDSHEIGNTSINHRDLALKANTLILQKRQFRIFKVS